jgi:transcriptional regulator with XRE-family HTH domain
MNEHAELLRLGETIRQVREQQRLSVAELTARTGIDARRIRKIEAARLDPTYDVLIALADGLGVRLSALVPGPHEGG